MEPPSSGTCAALRRAGGPARRRRPCRERARTLTEPEAGASLELTIDLQIQREAQKALQWGMRAAHLKRGVFMVMNPQNGEILAMVSLPTYDDNEFADGVTAAEYRRLLKDPRKPLLNLAISEQLPPGSTFKLVTGLGALQDRKITPQHAPHDQGFITVAGTRMHDWNPFGFGSITIFNGFAHSSDTFFYQVALKLGIDRLGYWAHELGFGRKTGIDLPGETVRHHAHQRVEATASSRSPSTRARRPRRASARATTWSRPSSSSPPMPRSPMAARLYRPQLVRKLLDSNGNMIKTYKPEVTRKLAVDSGMLRVDAGRGTQRARRRHTYNFVDVPLVIAGKSGTAEYSVRDSHGRLPFHSWFVGFTPKDARKSPATSVASRPSRAPTRSSRSWPSRSTPGPAATRAPRSRSTSCSSTTTSRRTTVTATCWSATTSTGSSRWVRFVSNLPGSAAFTPRAIVNVWSVFDIQLAVYALALVVIGLLMAFTNSGEAPLAAGSLFTAALMWLAVAMIVFIARGGRRLPLVADRSRGCSTSSTSGCWC